MSVQCKQKIKRAKKEFEKLLTNDAHHQNQEVRQEISGTGQQQK